MNKYTCVHMCVCLYFEFSRHIFLARIVLSMQMYSEALSNMIIDNMKILSTKLHTQHKHTWHICLLSLALWIPWLFRWVCEQRFGTKCVHKSKQNEWWWWWWRWWWCIDLLSLWFVAYYLCRFGSLFVSFRFCLFIQIFLFAFHTHTLMGWHQSNAPMTHW